MSTPKKTLTILTLSLVNSVLFPTSTASYSSYDNVFVNPDLILGQNFSSRFDGAQSTIVQWADQLAAEGPWSVMNKTVLPPSGDKHDYLSWAPYSWPNCTGVGNTTELTPEQVWTTCPYITKDGQFNPDRLLVNDTGHFNALADAVLYNGLAWAIQGKPSSVYSQNVARFINTWFIDPDSKMNPNLKYAQLARGPNGQIGQHTGMLDFKCMAKIASGVLLLREGKSPDWTTDIDKQFTDWISQYTTWLTTNNVALQEAAATNNHGSFYFNQLASLRLILNDKPGALNATNTYFSGIYQGQIDANGEQPLEAERTRPFHYRCYNLNAAMTNALLADYADPSSKPWNRTTKSGATIKAALDFTMTVDPAKTDEVDNLTEMYIPLAIAVPTYGDPDGKYLAYLTRINPDYAADPYFLWSQPLAGNASAPTNVNNAGSSGSTTGTPTPGKQPGAAMDVVVTAWAMVMSALLPLWFLSGQ